MTKKNIIVVILVLVAVSLNWWTAHDIEKYIIEIIILAMILKHGIRIVSEGE